MTRRVTGACLSLAALALAACGSAGAPDLGSTTSASFAAAASGDPTAALIEAARKEGEVSWAVAADFTDASGPVHDLVKTKYGLDLKINANGTLDYVAKVSKA